MKKNKKSHELAVWPLAPSFPWRTEKLQELEIKDICDKS